MKAPATEATHPDDEPAESAANWLPRLGAHIPALDGLRGLAILLVLIRHQTVMSRSAGPALDEWFARIAEVGWSGVDLFFVLSGFLITGILCDSKQGPHYFRNFYIRRTLRIFPLYYAVVFFSLVILPNLPQGFVPPEKTERFGSIRGDEIFYWLYLSNFSIAAAGEWRHGILDISWSLAIEEQFYILWPTVVFLLSRRSLMRLCGVLVALALAIRVGMTLSGANPIAIYVITPARMDELAIGAFIALAARGPGGILGLVPAARWIVAGTLPILVAGFLWRGGLEHDDPLVQTVGFTLLGLLFGALLVLSLAALPGSGRARLFQSSFMRSFGKYSYALYLFHLPLRALIRDTVYGKHQFLTLFGSQIPGQLVFYVAATALAFACALVSWHLLEKRFLRLKDSFPTAPHRSAGIDTP